MTYYLNGKGEDISATHSLIRGFREAVDVCALEEVRMIGYQYTWERSRGRYN